MGCCTSENRDKEIFSVEESNINTEYIFLEKTVKETLFSDADFFKMTNIDSTRENYLDVDVLELNLPDPDTSKSINSWKESSAEPTVKLSFHRIP